MAKHKLEKTYGLSAKELLDAVSGRFRLQAALEGAVAEVQMEREIAMLKNHLVERFEAHDLDGVPDFSIWLAGRKKPLRLECKNVRESGREGGEGYRQGGEIVAYKVETQKTRASKDDPTSRYYDIRYFDVLGVCLGKKTGDWSEFVYARTVDLQPHEKHPGKLAVFQRVPLPTAENRQPWYDDLSQLIQAHYTRRR